MASEAIPNDETVPLFVFDSAVPAMGGGRILNRRRQRKGPIAGMARSYTEKKGRVSRELPWCFPGFPQKKQPDATFEHMLQDQGMDLPSEDMMQRPTQSLPPSPVKFPP